MKDNIYPSPQLRMNKLFILVIIGIFIIPLSSIIQSVGGLWYSQYIALLICLLIGIAVFLWNFNKYISILDAVLILSTFFITKSNARAIILLLNFNLGCLASYAISNFNSKQRAIIIRSIFVLFMIQILWLTIQLYNKDPFFHSIYNHKINELVGFSASPDQLGTFFALTLPIALYIHPLFSLLSLAGIFISKSAFALVSGIIGMLIYLYYTQNKILMFILTLIIVPLIFFIYFKYMDKVKYADFQTRGNVWRYAVSSTLKGELGIEKFGNSIMIKTSPIYGFGFGQFLTIFPFVPQKDRGFNYIDEKFNHAHNDIIEIFVFELGIAGIIIFMSLLINFIMEFIFAKKSKELVMFFSCILIYLLNSTGNFLSQIAVSGMLLMIYYGMYQGVIKNGEIAKTG